VMFTLSVSSSDTRRCAGLEQDDGRREEQAVPPTTEVRLGGVDPKLAWKANWPPPAAAPTPPPPPQPATPAPSPDPAPAPPAAGTGALPAAAGPDSAGP